MNKSPETYEELIRQKRCVDLTKYYELTSIELERIYQFLEANSDGVIKGNTENISLMKDNNVVEILPAKCVTSSIDGLFHIIHHHQVVLIVVVHHLIITTIITITTIIGRC